MHARRKPDIAGPDDRRPGSRQDPRSYFQAGRQTEAERNHPAHQDGSRGDTLSLVEALEGLREGPLRVGMSGASAMAVLMEEGHKAPDAEGSTGIPPSQLPQQLQVSARSIP